MTDQEIYNSYKSERAKVDAMINELPLPAKEILNNEPERLQKEQEADHILSLTVGDKAPDFTLKNAIGKDINLYEVLKKQKVVLTFYRGTWCPYCNLQLTKFQEVTFKLKSIGSAVIAVSPQNPDDSLDMKQKNKLEFEVLSDPGNKVALNYTSLSKKSTEFVKTIDSMGKKFADYYGNNSHKVPVPAVFIIDQDGTIVFAKTEGGDYRDRVEATEIIDALS